MSDQSQGDLYRNRARTMTAHSEFLGITGDRYYAMQDRLVEKRSKSGHIIRVGRQLPFTLDEYRHWCRQILGGEMGCARCFYCAAPIDIHTMVTEHLTPLVQGGALDLSNLCASCAPCNDQKGCMRAQAFSQLLTLTNNATLFSAVDRTDLLGRLQRAMKLAIKVRRNQAEKQTVVPHIREPRVS